MVQIIGEFGAAAAEAADSEQEAPEPRGFLFAGALFFIEDDLSFIPYGKFCQAALSGRDTEEAEGAAAVMDMMRDIIGADPGEPASEDGPGRPNMTKAQEWARFCDVGTAGKSQMVDMMQVIRMVMSGDAGRPTQPPAGSRPGRSKTATSRSSNGKPSKSGDPRKRANAKTQIKEHGAAAHDFEPVTDDVIAGLAG